MKKFAKLMALALALVMVLSLAACGGKAPADNGGAKTYTIGINTWGSGVPVLDMFGNAKQYTIETLGHKVNRMSDDFTADKELQNVQNMCASGVDGAVVNAAAVSTVPQIGVEFANAKIPFAFDVFVGENPDLEKLAKENPYYCGAIDLDMVADGAAIAEMAYANGARKAVMIGGNIGDNNMDQRSQGFTQRFTELGGTVYGEARCTDNSECLAKATDILSAYSDADCLYAFVGDYIEGSLTAIENLGMDVQVYVSCVDEGTANYIKAGTVVGGNDGISLASYISSTLVLNYLAGNKIVDENGMPPRLSTSPFRVDQSNVDNYLKVFFSTEGYAPFTKAMLEDLTRPDVTYQDYVDLITNINLDYMLESNGIK
ncbi:MAG: substrate-binding domain-containing protein [Oscillospiraceae bacterium]|nr:substrate-binding domain-containing protein [Oscillospiraceae bacterium]